MLKIKPIAPPPIQGIRQTRGSASYRRGIRAELIALVHLMAKGYWPHALRYRCKGGEVDIIARKGDIFAAIEVKARPNLLLGHESMNEFEWHRRRAAMAHFIRRKRQGKYTIRFDLIIVAPYFQIQHLEAAWQSRF
ncbi:MAG TPA: YraN family protein [Alphaproteobacteria bacterium]|nr:YraN family protein [Alphaproteobacteria bacterium]